MERKCSFCGKSQPEVRLVAGPRDVAICNLCVALCQEILAHPEPPGPTTSGLTVTARSEPSAT